METLIPIIAITGTFTSVIVVAYLFFNSRHKIRMALIQHNKEAGIFKEDKDAFPALKYGMVAVGLGLGLFIGSIAEKVLAIEEGTGIFGMMLIFGGAGLVLYYMIAKSKSQGDDIV